MNGKNLISYEFHKYFTRFNILLLLLLCILNLGVTVFTHREAFTKDYREFVIGFYAIKAGGSILPPLP